MAKPRHQDNSEKISASGPVAVIRRRLLAWYDKNHRRLPWRQGRGRKPDPYHILVSELMLQQTQVATVIPYFQRFVERFPSLESLATADEQEVLHLWQGLGYYRRARHLHAAARCVKDLYAGRIPDRVEDLLALPGVGRYTAGAIASIAFNKRAAILDGNVARLIVRWYAIDKPVAGSATRERLWSLAQAHVPANRCGDFNQAMMDLGATVCLPRDPRCGCCPVAGACLANQAGCADTLPVRAARRPPRRVAHHALAIERNGFYLFQQRPDTGLWSAMWQLPTLELDAPRQAGVGQLQQWVKQNLGLGVAPPRRRCGFKHQTTHRSIGFSLWTTTVQSGRLRRGGGRWQRLHHAGVLPLANPQRRMVGMLAR